MTETSTSTLTITYRRTKSGEWVAYGPADRIAADRLVTVAKRNGEHRDEIVERTGRPFDVDGVEMVYGYLAPHDHSTRPATPRTGCCAACGRRLTAADRGASLPGYHTDCA